MNRWLGPFATLVLAAMIAVGCSDGNDSPLAATAGPGNPKLTADVGQPQMHLWGYYTVYMDLASGRVEAIPMRNATGVEPSPWNVANFINGNPANLSFHINKTIVGDDGIDVDIDVSITHPFPGMSQYNGYDVRGIFIGDGHGTLEYSGLRYAVRGVDQYLGMPPDPWAPDGYTRWWNPDEFPHPGILGYTKGIFATPGYQGSATLNPYMYFADGLGAEADLMEFLVSTGNHGVFSAGKKNTRNYRINFPTPTPNVKFNYAIVASWEGEDIHPANGSEAMGITAEVTDSLYYVDPTDWGGDLILDLGVFDWSGQLSLAQTEYRIKIESDLIDGIYELTDEEMAQAPPYGPYPTYHVEIPVTHLTGTEGNEYWVIIEYADLDYSNEFDIPNDAWSEPLAALFRDDVYVSDTPYNTPPVVDSGVDGDDTPHILMTETYSVTAHDDDGDPLSYSWTVSDTSGPLSDYDGVPGDGNGNLDVDWAAIGANIEDVFDIDCEVDDGIDSVPATTLTVTATNVLWEDDMESGQGDWLTFHSGNGVGWQIVSGGNDGHWWHSNGGNTYLVQPDCARLYTPEITIPSGAGTCYVQIFHTVRGYFWSNTITQGAMVTASYDDGTSFDTTYKPPVVSGEQYTNETYPYQNTYFYGLCNGGCNYGGPGSMLCWGWRVWANSHVTNTTNTMNYSPYAGDTIRVGFIFASGIYNGSYYWGLDDVKVIAEP